MAPSSTSTPAVERAALVSVVTGSARRAAAEVSLAELAGLADAAGATVVLTTVQERPRPDPATFIGRGKVQSLAAACAEADVDVVICDNELSPAQLRHLEDELKCKVLDRTQLILDIFARRARTREGKRQVELAQLKYLLPRLAGSGTALSRLGGGIGTRGPGETKLETDRRRIRARIDALQREIDHVRQRRSQLRERREKRAVPTVALVGYTNAGKTTLFNRLTGERAVASDALFVTLDPLVRQIRLPDSRELLLSDTVGFIDRLPHALVAAFRATLEEVVEADLILHVIDASNPEWERQVAAVERVLEEVGAGDAVAVQVFNKVDAIGDEERRRLRDAHDDAAFISARTGDGVGTLLDRITEALGLDTRRVTVSFDNESADDRQRMARLYRLGRVVSHVTTDGRAVIEADVPRRMVERILSALVVVIVAGMVLSSCAPRRVPAVPGAGAYPEFVYPSDRGAPPAVAARLDRVWALLQANDLKAATRDVGGLLEQAPGSVAARTAQGYVALANKLPDVALRAFDASLGGRPSFAPALAGRGHALLALRKDAEALAAFEAALAANPELAEVRRRADAVRLRVVDAAVAEARAARAAKRFDQARAHYTRAIQASPESAFLYRDRAAVAREQRDEAAAVADLRHAAALEPTDADGLAALAGALAATGQLREAETIYRRAFALDPSEAIRVELARVSAQLRDNQLPGEVRDIEARGQLNRGDLAALLGIRFESLLRAVPAVQLVITDLRDDWSRTWITTVAGTGVMEPYPNHTFQPSAPAVRADLAAASWRLLALAAPARPALQPYLRERPQIADMPQKHPLYFAAASAVASGTMPLLDGGKFDAARTLSGADAAAAVRHLRTLLALE
ncbi:MAG TPA: GTPase HflX [Vicinamibacterales bacterium]|nr:GTPase HflX [Vicinamibacterales bacterium]